MQNPKQSPLPALSILSLAAPDPAATTRTYLFGEHSLSIDLTPNYLLYPATAMAQLFNQDASAFLSTPQAKQVIAAQLQQPNLYRVLCLNPAITYRNQPENQLDLILKIEKDQVWVNALLALRLASFLGSQALELWVLQTRFALHGEYRRRYRAAGFKQTAPQSQFGVTPCSGNNNQNAVYLAKQKTKVLAPIGNWHLLPGQKFTFNQTRP